MVREAVKIVVFGLIRDTSLRCRSKDEHLSSTSLARESQGLAQQQVRVSFRRKVGFADRHRF